MNQKRLSLLQQYYEEDPNDPFNIYALATEYKNKEPEKALDYFRILMQQHPDYVATYYHLAHLYIDLGEGDEAKAVFEKGIEKATEKGQSTLLRELKSAYDEFMMDY
jgi:tetratricopeptide (TPR) repeat protein